MFKLIIFYLKNKGQNGQLFKKKKKIFNFCIKHYSPTLIDNLTIATNKFIGFYYNLKFKFKAES